jgi:hypothetical protein
MTKPIVEEDALSIPTHGDGGVTGADLGDSGGRSGCEGDSWGLCRGTTAHRCLDGVPVDSVCRGGCIYDAEGRAACVPEG